MSKPEKAEVFISLLSRHERRLSVYVMALIANQSDAEDLLQEVKMVMWRSFDQFRQGTNFGAWSRKVALNQIMTFRKRQKRDLLYFSDELLEMIAADFEQNNELLSRQQAMLEQCIEKLPHNHKSILRSRYHNSNSIESIADKAQRTPGAVYRLLSRIRSNLHQCVTATAIKLNAYE
jgi:RNA polymerase sigma-70 factor (ECF subfamily)